MSTANIIVLCSFAAYMVIMIIIGFVSSKGTKTTRTISSADEILAAGPLHSLHRLPI